MSGYSFPILSRLAKGVSESVSSSDATANAVEVADTHNEKAMEDAVREERFLSSILEVARRLYFETGLVGGIDVYRTFAIYSSYLHCDVDGTDLNAFEDGVADNEGNLSMFERRAMDAVKGAIATLKHRARAYRNKSYRKDLTLTCGLTFSDPFLGMISTSVQCSASVASLLGEDIPTKPVSV